METVIGAAQTPESETITLHCGRKTEDCSDCASAPVSLPLEVAKRFDVLRTMLMDTTDQGEVVRLPCIEARELRMLNRICTEASGASDKCFSSEADIVTFLKENGHPMDEELLEFARRDINGFYRLVEGADYLCCDFAFHVLCRVLAQRLQSEDPLQYRKILGISQEEISQQELDEFVSKVYGDKVIAS